HGGHAAGEEAAERVLLGGEHLLQADAGDGCGPQDRAPTAGAARRALALHVAQTTVKRAGDLAGLPGGLSAEGKQVLLDAPDVLGSGSRQDAFERRAQAGNDGFGHRERSGWLQYRITQPSARS